MTRDPCRKRTVDAVLRAEFFGYLITAEQITMSSMREVNLETISDTQSVYKIQPLNGFNLIRAKTKKNFLRRRNGVYSLLVDAGPNGTQLRVIPCKYVYVGSTGIGKHMYTLCSVSFKFADVKP